MPKFIKCPDCGYVFKRPLVDQKKRVTIGFSPPGLGVLICPNCKVEKRRKYFEVVPESEAGSVVQQQVASNHKVEVTSEKDLIEDSRYEDE